MKTFVFHLRGRLKTIFSRTDMRSVTGRRERILQCLNREERYKGTKVAETLMSLLKYAQMEFEYKSKILCVHVQIISLTAKNQPMSDISKRKKKQ